MQNEGMGSAGQALLPQQTRAYNDLNIVKENCVALGDLCAGTMFWDPLQRNCVDDERCGHWLLISDIHNHVDLPGITFLSKQDCTGPTTTTTTGPTTTTTTAPSILISIGRPLPRSSDGSTTTSAKDLFSMPWFIGVFVTCCVLFVLSLFALGLYKKSFLSRSGIWSFWTSHGAAQSTLPTVSVSTFPPPPLWVTPPPSSNSNPAPASFDPDLERPPVARSASRTELPLASEDLERPPVAPASCSTLPTVTVSVLQVGHAHTLSPKYGWPSSSKKKNRLSKK